VIGPQNRAVHAVVPACRPFKVTCPECNTENLYGQSDLEEHNLEDPPKGCCKEFVDAIVGATDPDSRKEAV
jgi:hypothetical protein